MGHFKVEISCFISIRHCFKWNFSVNKTFVVVSFEMRLSIRSLTGF